MSRLITCAIWCLILATAANACAQQVSATGPATAPSPDIWIWVESDRHDSLHHAGDTVDFAITVLEKKLPVTALVDVSVVEDGVSKSQQTLKVVDGKAHVHATLNHPGFLRCDVTYQANSGSGGAGFDVAEIKPALAAPNDFDAFWDAQKKELASIPMELVMHEIDSGHPQIICYELEAKSAVGQLRGYLARPRESDHKLPALVTVRGGGVFDSQRDVAVGWARAGFMVLDWNIHGLEHNKGKDYYASLRDGDLKGYATRGCESRETLYLRGVILRMLRACDVICAQPQWDGKHLIITGASQGGGLALIAGGLDARVSLVIAQVPGLCDVNGAQAGRANGWPRFTSNEPGTKSDPKIVSATNYYEAAHFASRYKGDAQLTVGFVDRSCFPTGAYAAYNQLTGKKQMLNLTWLGHTFSVEGNQAEWNAIERHLAGDAKFERHE